MSTSTSDQLDRLVCDPDTTVAIAAGWERVSSRTMPKDSKSRVREKRSRVEVSRFLGLVEGRTRVPIPNSSEVNVKSTTGYSQTHIRFEYPRAFHKEIESAVWDAAQEGPIWTVKKGNQLIQFPAANGGMFSDASG